MPQQRATRMAEQLQQLMAAQPRAKRKVLGPKARAWRGDLIQGVHEMFARGAVVAEDAMREALPKTASEKERNMLYNEMVTDPKWFGMLRARDPKMERLVFDLERKGLGTRQVQRLLGRSAPALERPDLRPGVG